MASWSRPVKPTIATCFGAFAAAARTLASSPQWASSSTPIGPSVAAGLIYFPLADFPELVDHHRKRISRFPNELTTWFFLRLAPPVSTMPKQCFGARRRHLAGVSRQETVDCRIFGSERAIDRHRVKSKDDVEEVRRLDKNCRRRSISSGPDHAACARAHCANDDQAPTLQA